MELLHASRGICAHGRWDEDEGLEVDRHQQRLLGTSGVALERPVNDLGLTRRPLLLLVLANLPCQAGRTGQNQRRRPRLCLEVPK